MSENCRNNALRGGEMSISIVIVNYNGRELLDACLTETVAQATAQDAEVILVDNASTDGSVEHVRERFPTVHIVRNARNEGFAGGCNAGVRAASGDTLVLLNNDAVPDPGWLRELVDALQPEEVAIACSVIHDPRFPEAYALGTGSLSVIGHPIPSVLEDHEHPFYGTGCSLAFKRSLFGEPFDPLYFAYYEDALLSWRAHLTGYRVARAVKSSVQHLGSVTALQQPSLASFFNERNKLLTLLLAFQLGTLAKLMPLYLFDSLARLVEDVWLIAEDPRTSMARAAPVVHRYALVLRGLLWICGNVGAISARRRAIQRTRMVTDAAITPMLSGKIFDDHIQTRGHEIANSISRRYCTAVGIVTAEASQTTARNCQDSD